MIRALQITHDYYGSKVYRKLFQAFREDNRIENIIAVPLDPDNLGGIMLEDEVYNIYSMKKRRFGAFKAAKDTYAEIEKNVNLSQIDIVHAHYARDGLTALRIKHKYGIPYVISARRSCLSNLTSKLPYKRWIIQTVMRNASEIIFISHTTRQMALENISGRLRQHVNEHSHVIANGIDDFWHKKADNRNRELHNPIRVLSVGGVSKLKNQLLVARALSELNANGVEYLYQVVGPIVEPEIYDKLIQYPFVEYLGAKPMEELIPIYRNADIFAVPSLQETFGLVYAEALSQGLPVIFSKGEGFDGWFQDQDIGLAVDAKNLQAIEAAIRAFSAPPTVNAIRKRVEMSRQFDWSLSSEQFMKVYEKACIKQ